MIGIDGLKEKDVNLAIGLKVKSALEKKDFATFFNKITESGDSSWKWLQNCYCNETPDEQSITVALALTKLYLDKIGHGVCRVHGGGFAGVIAAFLPKEYTEGFTQYIDKALPGRIERRSRDVVKVMLPLIKELAKAEKRG